MLFLPFSDSLLIICGVNQRPVSKSKFANLITVLFSTGFHFRCAASLILTCPVPGVTRVKIGVENPEDRFSRDEVQFHLFMFKEFRCPEKYGKVLSVHYISPDRPKIMNGLIVDLS